MTKMTIQQLGELIGTAIKDASQERGIIRAEVSEIKGDVSSIKDDIAMIKAMMVKSNPNNAEIVGALACPNCGRQLTKGEIDFCRKNNIEPSCYACRKPKKAGVNAPKRITKEEATTKVKYIAKCTNADGTHHTFEYTKPTYYKYVARCRELRIPILLCPICAKRYLDAQNAQPQADNGVDQAF